MNNYLNLQLIDRSSEQLSNRYQQTYVDPLLHEKLLEVMQDADSFNANNFMEFKLEEIYQYLKCSHQYYLDVWIPKLENTLLQLNAKLGADYKSINMLTLSLNAYKRELVLHIDQEEKILFTFVERLLAGKDCDGLKDLVLNHFIHTHDDNVILEIDQLKREVLSIDADLQGNLIVEVLFNQLHIFQQDLKVHGLIEDKVFLQKVIAHSS